MTKPASPQPTWTKPRLVHLGKLAAVTGPKTVSSNGASAGFANS